MADRSFRSTSKSKKSLTDIKRPTSYRVLLKSRSGFLQEFNDTKSFQMAKLKHKTLQSENKINDIRSFVKTMKNRPSQHTVKNIKQNRIQTAQSMFEKSLQQQRSQLANIRKTPQRIQQEDLLNISINQIEKQVDYLLQLKLIKTKDIRHMNRQQIQQIDRKIAKFVQILQNYDIEQNDQLGRQQKLQISNRKIYILQKIMAESATQSEIAKKYFYGKKTNRKQRKPIPYKVDLKMLKQMTKNVMQRSMPASLHFQSTNKVNFKAPDKKDYPLKPNKQIYQFNNQPIPRSSYGRDYLIYGNLPKFTYKQESSNLMPNSNVGKRSSSYKSQFTIKKIQKINFKQLDCYQDKFKNLKVSFMQSKAKFAHQSPNLNDNKSLLSAQQVPYKLTKHSRHKTEHTHYIQNLSTQSRVNFTGQNNKIKSQIKHKHLNDLKYAFKASVKA